MEKLIILERNITFSRALEALKEDKLIKLPEYRGYWFLRGGMIVVKQYNGKESTEPWLKETVLREDWQIVENNKEWEESEANAIMQAFRTQGIQFVSNESFSLDVANQCETVIPRLNPDEQAEQAKANN